jgi:branched-chain amino acid aminotransferase
MVVFLDGQKVAVSDAKVSVFDHGFLFGDSVYEVVRTVTLPGERGKAARRLFAFEPHADRLFASARGINLDIPWTKAELRAQVERAVNAVDEPGNVGRAGEPTPCDVYVRIIITRGVGELDLSPETCEQRGSIIIAKPLPVYPRAWYDDGITLRIVGTMRNPSRATSPSIKSGNYLNNVIALMEARGAGALEAVMLNEHGHLTECTTSNVFWVKDGALVTPSLDCGILSGITRSLLLDVARSSGVTVKEGCFPASDLRTADEVFITSTTKDLVPVKTIDGAPVRSSPGPVTKRLSQLFIAHVHDSLRHAGATK